MLSHNSQVILQNLLEAKSVNELVKSFLLFSDDLNNTMRTKYDNKNVGMLELAAFYQDDENIQEISKKSDAA